MRDRNDKLSPEKVEDLEAFALEKGISAEQIQDLVDRVGHDRRALEDAALVLQAEEEN